MTIKNNTDLDLPLEEEFVLARYHLYGKVLIQSDKDKKDDEIQSRAYKAFLEYIYSRKKDHNEVSIDVLVDHFGYSAETVEKILDDCIIHYYLEDLDKERCFKPLTNYFEDCKKRFLSDYSIDNCELLTIFLMRLNFIEKAIGKIDQDRINVAEIWLIFNKLLRTSGRDERKELKRQLEKSIRQINVSDLI